MINGIARAVYGAAKTLADSFPRSNLVGRVWRGVKNWYEAGWPFLDGGRAYIPSLIQDARWDQNFVTRREMMRRMRYWSQNSPLLESMLSVGERYTVGTSGLHVSFYPVDDWQTAIDTAKGGDAAAEDDNEDPWYENAELVVKEWFKDCGWNGESMSQLLKVGYRDQRVDGDIFFIKTRKRGQLQLSKNQTINISKPALLMVEAHRVETPFNEWAKEGREIVDGVAFREVNQDGQILMDKIGYHIRIGFGAFETESRWILVRKEDCWHIYNSHRANQFRGISDFYSVEDHLGKLFELVKMEMRAQDTQSDWAVLIKNAAGQLPPDPKVAMAAAARGQNLPTTAIDPQKLTEITNFYRKIYGGNTKALKLGEDAEMKAPMRPSEATLQLWEYLINAVCAGGHAPRCLTFGKLSAASAKGQGTEVRGDLDNADKFYKGDHEKWAQFLQGAVIWFLEWAIKNDPRVADPPASWRNCIHIQQPESCNVDVGHTTQAALMLLAAGASDYDAILGPLGVSFHTVIRKLRRQQRLIKKYGVEVTLPGLLKGQIPLTGTKPPTDNEPAEAIAA
jgi:hypothetical protein